MSTELTTIRTVGGLLPPDVLARVLAADAQLEGLRPADYHLAAGETPREAANRAWSYLTGAWSGYRSALAKLPEGDPAIGLTREKWLMILLGQLGYGRVPTTAAGGIELDSRLFPVSHLWERTPMHLLGWGVDLDKRTKGVPGAAERAPHAMLQELLNRSERYLWGILSNGHVLRLLRDSTSLSGQAFVEFDLEAMFDAEVFSDFVLLYLLVHQSRVEVAEDASASDCWLEKWRTSAVESGTRALGLLRDGVKDALEALGTGFLRANSDLNARIASGELRLDDYHRSLLRTVYRLLFLFVAEDRGALLSPDADAVARQRYADFFSTSRLRRLSIRRRGTRHGDLWDGLSVVIDALGREDGRPELGLVGIGGLFDHGPQDVVTGLALPNEALLMAVRRLTVVQPKGQVRRTVDYRNLGAEELGSIYESLLELVPRHQQVECAFTLEDLAGNDRKTSGSYYTPSSLIDLVLDEALDPLLDEAEESDDPAAVLLAMTVCDPACGSGHFLVAAARRIASRLATARTGEIDPTPADLQRALHDVVARCIYGVDLNPMAADLAKVSLWLEAMAPGRPLSFLDAHIKVGNALLGTTPELLAAGVPDGAFVPIEGDDKKHSAALKKRNRTEREADFGAQEGLFDVAGLDVGNAALRAAYSEVEAEARDALSLSDVQLARTRYRELQGSPEAHRTRLLADTWCAAFVQPKVPGAPPITHEALTATTPDIEATVEQLTAQYRFFHWHLEFPEIFPVNDGSASGGAPAPPSGFSLIVGNPPWERLKIQESEYFAAVDVGVAKAKNAAERRRRIVALWLERPDLEVDFNRAKRQAEAVTHFARASGRYEFGAAGDVNTYALFADLMLNLVEPAGRGSMILPVGLVTGYSYRAFVQELVQSKRLFAFVGFENGDFLFRDVHDQIQFGVLVLGGNDSHCDVPTFASRLRQPWQYQTPERRYELSGKDLSLLNPSSGTLPLFRFARDAEVTSAIYRASRPLAAGEADDWPIRFSSTFHMSNDAGLFVDASDLGSGRAHYQPLYEGRFVWTFDHRYGTYDGQTQAQRNEGKVPHASVEEHSDPAFEVAPRYFVRKAEVQRRVPDASERWWIGYRRMGPGERSFVPALIPGPSAGDSLFLISVGAPARIAAALLGWLGSIPADYVLRQKANQMSFFVVQQVPVPSVEDLSQNVSYLGSTGVDFLADRAIELSYTGYDLDHFGERATGSPRPFIWQEQRRQVMEAEIHAAAMHLLALSRSDAEWILDSFRVLSELEIGSLGEFETKRLTLERFDAMSMAADQSTTYVSPLDPPPGQGPRHASRADIEASR